MLLALPLGVAVWELGSYVAHRDRTSADARLAVALRGTVAAYRQTLVDAERRARTLADSRRVQRVLAARDLRSLTRLRRENANVAIVALGAQLRLREGAAVRTISVVSRGKPIGQIAVFVPFDDRLLARLKRGADLPNDVTLGLLRGRRGLLRPGRPTEVDDRGSRYRVVAAPLRAGPRPVELVVRERAASIDASADGVRGRVIAVGFSVLAAMAFVAYALAPALARTRTLKQQRELAARVLSHIGDGVFMIDSGGVVRVWNAAAEAATGLRAGNVIGRPIVDVMPAWPTIAPLVPVAPPPGAQVETARAETVPFDVNGKEVWLSISGVGFSDGSVYAFRDVTSEQQLEAMRTGFVATVSHELRTPLASLYGAALTLRQRRDRLTERTQLELLDMIAEQSKRLADLVEEILVASQLDAGSLRVVHEAFDPDELVRSTVELARMHAPDPTRIHLSTPSLPPKVVGDPERTGQVLANLLDNAIKYSPGGGSIELTVESAGDHVRFAVHDMGLGIPRGEEDRIFEKFYRLDPDHVRGISGSGLGLYICRELVRSMNGRIWVESEPDEGTTFAFELPVAERSLAPT